MVETQTNKVLIFLEKWILFILVLGIYLFLSYKIIEILTAPDSSPQECGTGLFAMLIGHIFLAIVATIVLALRLFLSKGYSVWNKITVFLLILIPPIISFSVFF